MLVADLRVRRDDFVLEARFEALEDEIVAVVGPNGSGKTTLLRAIAGLEPIEEGVLRVGTDIWENAGAGQRLSPEERLVGYVPQDGLLFENMSILDNVAFGSHVDPGSARQWLTLLGLDALESAMPHQLSGGQTQLVALARALARKPEVLLLDEPLASVDAANRAEVRRQLRRQLNQAAAVRILVTHDAVEAAALADRIVVLDNGKITQRGTIDQLLVHPRSAYVAQLVGVNFYTGVARDGVIEVTGGGVLHSPEPTNGEVIASIHPRAVALHTQRPSGTPRNVWQGVVESIEPSLDRVRIAVEADLPVVAEVTRAGAETVTEGAHVWVSIKASEVMCFPQ